MPISKEVEILPMLHYATLNASNELLAYLSKLPSNSTIFAEVDQKDLVGLNRLIDYLYIGGINPFRDIFMNRPNVLFTVELMLLIKEKKFNIIPLSSLKTGVVDIDFDAPSFLRRDVVEASEIWERQSSDFVKKQFPNETQKVYLLIGALHSNFFQKLLSQLGLDAKINLDYTKEKEQINDMLIQTDKARELVLKGNIDLARKKFVRFWVLFKKLRLQSKYGIKVVDPDILLRVFLKIKDAHKRLNRLKFAHKKNGWKPVLKRTVILKPRIKIPKV